MKLTFDRVSIGYPGHPVLCNLSLSLVSGSLCCLLGANGCGKTTLLRSILGLLPLSAGRILLDGEPADTMSAAVRARRIAWVPQAHGGPFAFRVIDMVMMGLTPHQRLFSLPGKAEKKLALAQLELLGIAELAERSWLALSGGERQLVLIARALVQQPQLLLMDEPASSLDFGHQSGLLDRIQQLRTLGMTILMSTHHPLHARAVADSVLCIEPDGRISLGDPVSQLQPDALATLYRVSPEHIRKHLGNSLSEANHAD